jgi:hypothetical protein
MEHLRHAFSLQTGANGNVIAYNYSRDPFRSEVPTNFGGDISLHGHYPFSNLFEGNIVQNIHIDQTWGPSGPYNTFFRNRAELLGIIMTSGTVQSDSMNFVGNETTNTSIAMGNYLLYGSGHFEYANNIKGIITPPGATTLPDSSYYLSWYPPFWTTTIFPTIGIPNLLNSGNNPAFDRYGSGANFTVCEDNFVIGVDKINATRINVYPNPTTGEFIIEFPFNSSGFIYVKDINGKIIQSEKIFSNKQQIKLNHNLSGGIYFVEVVTDEGVFVNKIQLIK